MGENDGTISVIRKQITSVEPGLVDGVYCVEYEFVAVTNMPGFGRHCVIDFYCPDQTWITGISASLEFSHERQEHSGSLNLVKKPGSFRISWLSWAQ